MEWLSLALLSRLLFAVCGIFDSHYRHYFSSGYAQTVFFALFALIAGPILLLIIQPAMPPPTLWLPLLGAGFVMGVWIIPYFEAIKLADASAIASMFGLGRIFIPIFAFFLIGEVLQPHEYAGFAIVIAGSLFLFYSPKDTHIAMKPFMLMLLAGFMQSLYNVMNKYTLSHLPVYDAWVYMFCISNAVILLSSLLPGCRQGLSEAVAAMPKIGPRYVVSFLVGNLGFFIFTLALSLTKVSYVVLVTVFQPFFVLAIMYVLRRFPALQSREDLEAKSIMKKISAFTIMATGLLITFWPHSAP